MPPLKKCKQRRFKGAISGLSVEAFGASIHLKNVGGRVSAPKTSFSLVACNKVKTQASGALNFRSFRECAVHSQHKSSVEA